eukprot:Phypoly_transcript_00938.p1 GENE.Phypoly_transcript_00938~~Phypoly_transcript_00938.p1  ORF type:complete len:1185 (+),score=222.47 Phypoly_transcript_00938:86-3640(+)
MIDVVRGWLGFIIPPDFPVDTYTRSLVLVILCFLMGAAKFISLLQVLSYQGPSFLQVGIVVFWMQLICVPFLIKRAKSLYILSHYTLAVLLAGVILSSSAGDGYIIVNCTVFPIMPLFATFLFGTFWDSFAWCLLLLCTNIVFYLFKANWEPGGFPSTVQLGNFIFFANMMSMSISAILGGVFNFSSSLKQKELERERDKAQELSKIKSEFTANVSHEIRTPLVAVIGLSELLAKDTLLTSDQRYLINTIYSASLHLDNLVNNVLNFSKTEANMTKLDRTTFDVSELVEETLLYFSAIAESCGIRLLSFIDPISTDGLCTVVGDPHRVQQILQNLVANAVKFCSESLQGEVLITLDTIPSKTKEFQGRWYRFSVADNGIGMSKAGLQKLFQPFSQCDTSTTRRYGGTGLGLVICKQLVTLLGGEIEVDSEEGKGTTITFTIPLDTTESANTEEHPHQRKRETAAASEAAAHAAASSADAAEEAELEASLAAKAATDLECVTHEEKRAAVATATAAKETARAAKATAEAAHTTAEAAHATAEVFEMASQAGGATVTSPIDTKRSPIPSRFAQKQPDRSHSPLRQAMHLTKPTDDESAPVSNVDALMQTLELTQASRISTEETTPTTPEILPENEISPDVIGRQEIDGIAETEPPLMPAIPEETEDELSAIAKGLVSDLSGWKLSEKNSEYSEDSVDLEDSPPESPFSKQMRTTLDDIQQILRQSEHDRLMEQKNMRQAEKSNPNTPSLVRAGSAPSPELLTFHREAQIESTRHTRSKSMTGLVNNPFSPSFRWDSASPPVFGARAHPDRKVSGGIAGERTPMFSPDFQKILAKSQDFWTSSASYSGGEMRRGTTGYLEPIGDSRRAWARIREGMRDSASSPEGDAVCVLAGSQGAREVIKSSLLFRGLTNTEVMDGDAYAKLLKLPSPPHFRVVIAEADLFAHTSAGGMHGFSRSSTEGLAEVLNPAIFDPRVSTRYILLISCKYHRFGKYIEFSVPPVEGGTGEDTVKVVFCANNPVRRSSLAQSLLACVAKEQGEGRVGMEGVRPRQDSPSQPSRSNLRILLCEDNLVNIEVLTRQLKKLGYTNCDIRNNGAEGVQAFKEKEYDIVLMDCQMPVLDGYEATKEIRRIEQERKAKKRVPIVALTASAMPEEREKGMKSGMDNYLSKPVQLAVLQNILESIQATS